MISFSPFAAGDLELLCAAPAQAWLSPAAEHGEAYAAGPGWTGRVDGRVVGCAGLIELWRGRWLAWALLGGIPRRCWPAVHRRVLRTLAEREAMGARRIEATVLDGFRAGERWAWMLGFRQEGLMRRYGPDGSDHWLYSRVRD